MARPVDPEEPGGGGDPGDPGYVPPTSPGTKIALIVTTTAITITEDQIRSAGGPWPSFTLRGTPVNDSGSGASQEVDVTLPTTP